MRQKKEKERLEKEKEKEMKKAILSQLMRKPQVRLSMLRFMIVRR